MLMVPVRILAVVGQRPWEILEDALASPRRACRATGPAELRGRRDVADFTLLLVDPQEAPSGSSPAQWIEELIRIFALPVVLFIRPQWRATTIARGVWRTHPEVEFAFWHEDGRVDGFGEGA